jgi:hypothetical protein
MGRTNLKRKTVMKKPLLLVATLGSALVAAMVLAAPRSENAVASGGGVMDRAAAYAMAAES